MIPPKKGAPLRGFHTTSGRCNIRSIAAGGHSCLKDELSLCAFTAISNAPEKVQSSAPRGRSPAIANTANRGAERAAMIRDCTGTENLSKRVRLRFMTYRSCNSCKAGGPGLIVLPQEVVNHMWNSTTARSLPQGLKPQCFWRWGGTAKAVPIQRLPSKFRCVRMASISNIQFLAVAFSNFRTRWPGSNSPNCAYGQRVRYVRSAIE